MALDFSAIDTAISDCKTAVDALIASKSDTSADQAALNERLTTIQAITDEAKAALPVASDQPQG